MAVTLEDVKLYLRIDGDAEDSLLQACMAAADSYLISAVSDFSACYDASADFAANTVRPSDADVEHSIEQSRKISPNSLSAYQFLFFFPDSLLNPQLPAWRQP